MKFSRTFDVYQIMCVVMFRHSHTPSIQAHFVVVLVVDVVVAIVAEQ